MYLLTNEDRLELNRKCGTAPQNELSQPYRPSPQR